VFAVLAGSCDLHFYLPAVLVEPMCGGCVRGACWLLQIRALCMCMILCTVVLLHDAVCGGPTEGEAQLVHASRGRQCIVGGAVKSCCTTCVLRGACARDGTCDDIVHVMSGSACAVCAPH
jgi:hypothetical protein